MATKNRVGRPNKIDDVVLGKLESAFKIGATDREACYYADINPDTLYEYQKKHPDFTEQKEAWKRNPILKAKHTIYNNLGDPNIAKWLLERRDDDYSNKIKQEVTNKTPQIVVATQADADLLKRIADVKPDKDVL